MTSSIRSELLSSKYFLARSSLMTRLALSSYLSRSFNASMNPGPYNRLACGKKLEEFCQYYAFGKTVDDIWQYNAAAVL